MQLTEIAKQMGKAGGNKTKQLYGSNHFKEAQKKSVIARKKNKEKLSPPPILTNAC